MSMDNDTRLAMMHMSNDAHRNNAPRPRRNNRARIRTVSSTVAAFALTLFTRGF